jgi:hypothetical protein
MAGTTVTERPVRTFKFIFAAIAIAAPFSANAQISWQPNFNLAPAILQAQVLNPCPDGDCGDESDSTQTTKAPRPSPSRALNPAKLNYVPSLPLRKRHYAQFVEKTRNANPSGAAELEAMFASTDVIAAMSNGLRPFGLRVDSLADAYTVYWVNAWLASKGRPDSATRAQAQAVRKQAMSALLTAQPLATATDAMKQELAETLLVQAALLDAAVQQAKSDPALMSQVMDAARKGALSIGFDVSTVTLTPLGFKSAGKRTGGVDEDIVPDSVETEQALTDIPNDSPGNSETTNYALIAAAGGAGLGGMFLLGKMMGRKS